MSHQKAPGVGIEPTTSWFRARRHYQQQLPRIALSWQTRSACRSSGRRIRTSTTWFKARQPTVSRSPTCYRCKSALWESNPPRQLGRLAPLPLGQGHIKRKERESNPQGLSLDCFRDSCHRQLACPSVCEAAAAGIEPASGRLTAACLYQHRPHRNTESGWQDLNQRSQAPRACAIPGFATPWQVGVAGFEPTLSCSRSRRISRLSHTPSKHPAGVEPALPPWQGSRLAATSWVQRIVVELSKIESTGWDSNPRRRITGAESSPLDDQCLSF